MKTVFRVLAITIITFMFFTFGCKSEYDHVFTLDNLKKDRISFSELPGDLQGIYGELAKTELFGDTLINNLDTLQIRMYKPTLDKDLFGLTREGFNHMFILEDSYVLKLKANKGDPFIFDNNFLYYTTELILDESNYFTSDYIRIDLGEILEEISRTSE